MKFNKIFSSSGAIREVQILLHVRNFQLEEGRGASPTRCTPEISGGIFVSNIRRQWLKSEKYWFRCLSSFQLGTKQRELDNIMNAGNRCWKGWKGNLKWMQIIVDRSKHQLHKNRIRKETSGPAGRVRLRAIVLGNFPGGLVVNTPCFEGRGYGFDPCLGN